MAATWFKYGCFGCLALVFLMVVAVAGFVGLAYFGRSEPDVEQSVAEHDLRLEGEPPPIVEAVPGASPAEGHVVVELGRAALRIEPGAEGASALRLETEYDRNRFELDESFERSPGGGWIYRVKFRGIESGPISSLRGLFGGTMPNVRLLLPRGAPMRLEARVEQGGADLRLDGLTIVSADFNVEMGGVDLRIDEPLAIPMERLAITVSMGGIEATRLGNASPRRLIAKCDMGGMELDLNGHWVADADISLETNMGGASVQLPPDVLVEGLTTRHPRAPRPSELKPPTLRFSVTAKMGEVVVKE